eukprot:scaffold14903_cov107-Isochrysis_galbana.AAC.3
MWSVGDLSIQQIPARPALPWSRFCGISSTNLLQPHATRTRPKPGIEMWCGGRSKVRMSGGKAAKRAGGHGAGGLSLLLVAVRPFKVPSSPVQASQAQKIEDTDTTLLARESSYEYLQCAQWGIGEACGARGGLPSHSLVVVNKKSCSFTHATALRALSATRWRRLPPGRPSRMRAKAIMLVTMCAGARSTGGRSVTVLRAPDGKLRCLDSICCHAGGPLGQGAIEEMDGRDCIVCPWHSYKISLDRGEKLYRATEMGPDGKLVPLGWRSAGVRQRCHLVYERNGEIFVELSREPCELPSDKYACRPER